MDGATHVPHIVETLCMFWRWQQLCATSSLHVSRRANESHNHADNQHNPCLQMYISWLPAGRLERHAPSAPLSLPTYVTEEEPLQFASTTLFDASISRLISRRLPMKSTCKFNTWQMSIPTRLQQAIVGAWGDQGRSTNEQEHSSFATHMILCNSRTTCPHCRFVRLDCTMPL